MKATDQDIEAMITSGLSSLMAARAAIRPVVKGHEPDVEYIRRTLHNARLHAMAAAREYDISHPNREAKDKS